MSKLSSMKQSYYELALSVQSWNEELAENPHGVAIQKIYSSAHFIIFVMRFSGVTRYFYLGRGKEFEGIYIGDENVSSDYRAQDSFLAYLRSHIRGGRLYNVVMDDFDRAVCLCLGRSKIKFFTLFFWRGRELFFIDAVPQKENFFQVTCSWERKKKTLSIESEKDLFPLFDDVGRKKLKNREKSNQCNDLVDYFASLASSPSKVGGRKRKSLLKKIELIKGDLIKFEKWNRLFQEVNKDQYPLDGNLFKQDGVKVKFTAEQNYYHRKSILLDKLKKYKEYKAGAQARLKLTESKLGGGESKSRQISTVFNPMTHRHTSSAAKSRSEEQVPEGVRFFTLEDGKVAVGLTAQGNDYIRNSWASKGDYWFHLDGDTGPHVIYKSSVNIRPEMSIMQTIASLIVDYAKLDYQQINIIYTQVKNLKAVKGSPGKVIYKKEKHLQLWKEGQWRKNILELQ